MIPEKVSESPAGKNIIRLKIESLPLNHGEYQVYACIRSRDGSSAITSGYLSPSVTVNYDHEMLGDLPVVPGFSGYVNLQHEWMIDPERIVQE